MEFARLKDWYLNVLHGTKHYANYPTYYLCNTPRALDKYTGQFSSVLVWNWNRLGQLDAYVPQVMRGLVRILDELEIKRGLPGSLLLVRAVR